MNAPVLLDLGSLHDALKRISLSDSWRIPSSKSDDVIWNIVLAYLNSFPLSDEDELAQRIECLTGHRKVNENIRASVQICNPFLNLNACFNDEVMFELVSIFKDRVEDYIKEREIQFEFTEKQMKFTEKQIQFTAKKLQFNAKQFQSNESLFHLHAKKFQFNAETFRYLEASSNLLHCTIALISFPIEDEIVGEDSKVLVQFFPKLGEIYIEHIGILEDSKPRSSNRYLQKDFAFCISKEIGMQKQRQALIEILKKTAVRDEKEKTIQKISHLSDVSENFIISLIKNDFGHIIPFIYTSPYVLSKLTDAGFETDPRTKDREGKSAFFHAFKTGEWHVVSLLYDHAANTCLQSNTSVLSPHTAIVENLRCLKDYLELMGKDLESEEISEKSRELFRDLCRFNEFQIEMSENINSIHYYPTEKEYEVLKRKETMLVILKTYKSYFDYATGVSAVSLNVDGNFSHFKNFFEHRDYYDKLDFFSAMMFFNNLFLLKEKLLLPKNAYLNVESFFFLFIFFRKHFEGNETEKCFYFVSQSIIYQKRLSLRKQLSNFQEILEKAKVDIINKIPKSIVTTLTNLPENYGQFLLLRLEHYSNTATECTVKDLKSILVVERCLEVMGECCKESDFNSVQRILTLALPKDLIKYLKQIRNHFAHIKSHELLYKNNLEQDVELFIGIQNELKMLKEFLLPIYSAHKYEMDRFLLLHSEKSVHEFRRRSILEKHENRLKATLPSPEMEGNQLSIPTSNYQHSWKSYFDDIRKKINELYRNGNILDTNTNRLYKFIIQNMISAVGVLLKNLKSPVPEKAVAELDSHFWCLENILAYIITDRMLASHRRTLILMLKNRKSFFIEWRENKSTNSIIDETLVAQDERVVKYLLTELEGTCENRKQTMNPIDIFKTFGYFFDLESCSQLVDANENENNGSFPKKPEISEANQVENETNEGNFGNGVSENVYDGLIKQETIDTKECKEPDDLCENSKDPETINLFEENDLPFTEAIINTTSLDGRLPTNVCLHYPVNIEVADVSSGSIIQETIDRKECKEAVDLRENTEDPEIINRIEENDLPFTEAISMASRDDWLLSNVYHNYPVNEAGDRAEIMDVKRKTFIENSVTFLDDYEKFANTIFQNFPYNSNEEFHFKNIEKFCLILKGRTFLNKREKEFIMHSVPQVYRNIPELKENVKALLKRETNFTEEIKTELFKLNLKNQEIKEIKINTEMALNEESYGIIDTARDYFLELKNKLELNEINRGDYELLCEKLKIPDDAKDILSKIVSRQNIKVPGNQFEFLRNRIKLLKNILIDEYNSVQQLWERATTPRRKMQVKEKIVQLYLNDCEIRAAVETLLFDCMAVLDKFKLDNLWRKTANLLNGVNLRNVLAHGHPLLESLGRLLDPCDLPSELVEKMLKLISDENVIHCIQQILELSGNHHKSFMEILQDEQFKNFSEQILECDHYYEYAPLVECR